MYLKSFSTYGFKSFADKIELDFASGITAIVGPNGSGKSNIADAVRWVLGEQSAKYLRGSKMEDVIFSGTGKRRALGVAEVTLVFDNADHKLALDFDEISVTRRVYRNGDSDYFINKKNCRLKDIVDLFADTGLGRGSMAVIGQNKVDEILNSRPEERRAIFEEAAGIAKYRIRKKEAVRRLDETAANLTRINDIKAEVESQVEPLRLAAEETKKYNALSAQLRQCKLAQFVHKIDNIENVRAKLNEKDRGLEQIVLEHTSAVALQQARCVDIQHRLDELSDRYNKIQDDIKDKETALEKVRGKQAVLQERARQNEKNSQRLLEQSNKLEQHIEQLEEQLKNLVAEYDALDTNLAAAKAELSRLTIEKDTLEAQLRQAGEQMEAMKSAAFDSMRRMVELRNSIRTLENEQEQRMRRRELLKKNIETAEADAEVLNNDYDTTLAAGAAAERALAIVGREIANAEKHEAAIKEAQAQAQAEYNKQQSKITALESRANILANMQKSYEGFGYAIKNVLQAQAVWRGDVIGVAAELIKVRPEHVTAIETALGGAAQNIVVGNAETAKQAINYLKQRKGGRATFLPLDTITAFERKADELALGKAEGILGFASDLVEYEERLAGVFRFLLGRVLVAQNMDAALNAAKKSRFRLRVVTLDGDVVNAGGSLTGGSRQQKEVGFLSRGKEIEAIEASLTAMSKQLLTCQEAVEEQDELLAAAQKQLLGLRKEQQTHTVKQAELAKALEHIQNERQQAAKRLELLLDDRSILSTEYMQARERLVALRPQLTAIENEDTEAKGVLDELQNKTAADERRLSTLRLQVQDAHVNTESSTAKLLMMDKRIQEMDAEMAGLQQENMANERERERLAATVEEGAAEGIRLQAEGERLLGELGGIAEGKNEFAEERLRLSEQQGTENEKLAALQKELTVAETKRNQAAMEMVRQNSDYDHALEQLTAEYRVTIEEARSESTLHTESDTALRRMEGALTKGIEALGSINPAAIEQYAAVSERYEFLNKQYGDLSQAKENLEAVIAEINSGMSKRFKEAFGKINEYFLECYSKLFNGGTAALRLSDTNDVLGSGIEIEVQPPGKKLQSLFLLSGGERALTVIALLFALLSYRPAPFCILDEVDAALDEANVDRFANFLAAYAEATQFIVITHRKGTMECAHVLHGVTMEESGVSKMLSVRLTEKE